MPEIPEVKTGWASRLTKAGVGGLLFLVVSGLAITLAPFSATIEWGVLLHTGLGLVIVVPLTWYIIAHWQDYGRYNMSDVLLLGYVAAVALLVCLVSGVVVTWQGLFGLRMSPLWRNIHLWSTVVGLITSLPHILVVAFRDRRGQIGSSATGTVGLTLGVTVVGVAGMFGLAAMYSGPDYVNEFPEDYSLIYGEDRPFAPSLAQTTTGGAFDAESLAGSMTCGTSNCHTQILEEWLPSAHRYSAMDPLFRTVQDVMADQNGPESTRYCGGCHDPISLFSGTKNLGVENLTGLHGYQEGVSCLVCHGVRETDLQGNANYVMTQPATYLWQWEEAGSRKLLSDFLIRTYPDKHNELSKRMFKAPEYCAACHKQFIDQEVNRVGWVQLQNQYDNWKASHWFVEGQPDRTIECRECHMPLIESSDPAAGDETDYNRTVDDGMHRSHRFIAANSLVPAMLELEGWEEQVRLTEEWLRGDFEIPEIADKWRDGPAVTLALDMPDTIPPDGQLPIRVVMTANKVGHDFPTGPLDIIQSWIELYVYDEKGNEVFSTGKRDERNFIEEGSFLFKAEPVDQYGNLIDRHNLWEMVGVRFRRALFPGYSDTVEYVVDCMGATGVGEKSDLATKGEEVQEFEIEGPGATGKYQVVASLQYRKVDQFLINFLLGEDSGLTAPVVEMARVTASVDVAETEQQVDLDEALPVAPAAG
jgi:hypothetical protein